MIPVHGFFSARRCKGRFFGVCVENPQESLSISLEFWKDALRFFGFLWDSLRWFEMVWDALGFLKML